LYARLITRVQEKKALAFLDTSHAPLRDGMRAGPFALKVNIEEAGELLGRHLESEQAVLEAARELQAKGTRLVALTRGAQGLVLAMEVGMVIAVPPPVTAISAVGAGDATLAGLLWAVTDQSDPVMTARRAVACGTAAAMQAGTGMGDWTLIQGLLARIKISLP
jgi:1-phosphofructokinase